MALLGAIVAGGKATRFGGDKGAALLNGTALIDHVAEGLASQVDALVIVGREWPELVSIADWPRSGIGPLGGLCAALRHAAEHGFDAVAMTPCDLLPVPRFAALGGGPTVIEGHEICGIWPASCRAAFEAFIATAPKLSMQAWIAESGATRVEAAHDHFDLNTPEALADFRSGG